MPARIRFSFSPVWRRWRRPYSTVVSSSFEVVQLPCHSSGAITLHIHHPLTRRDVAPILIYLPAGPIFNSHPLDQNHSDPDDEELLSALAGFANAVVVRIGYRHDPENRYPNPVHDVLAGYDWVLEHLMYPSPLELPLKHLPSQHVRLGVCGELVGGGLAVMLALTECRLGGIRIAAAAVNNPIVDWIFPENGSPSKNQMRNARFHSTRNLPSNSLFLPHLPSRPKATPSKSKPSSWKTYSHHPILSCSQLLHARDMLFHQPEAYFDRFASPILFFRTPSAEAPLTPTKVWDPISRAKMSISNTFYPSSQPQKICRLYPPSGSSLCLPHMRITVGQENILYDQVAEFVKLFRRSVARDHKVNLLQNLKFEVADQSRNQDQIAHEYAKYKAEFWSNPGLGLWTGKPRAKNWRSRIENVASWFRKSIFID